MVKGAAIWRRLAAGAPGRASRRVCRLDAEVVGVGLGTAGPCAHCAGGASPSSTGTGGRGRATGAPWWRPWRVGRPRIG